MRFNFFVSTLIVIMLFSVGLLQRMMLLSRLRILCIFVSIFIVAFGTQATRAVDLDLRNAVILAAKKPHVKTEMIATDMLQREVQKRTGLTWKISSERSGDAPVIAMVSMTENELCGLSVPRRDGGDVPEHKKERYRICVRRDSRDTPVVWVIGADARGILFGTGRLLRLLEWGPGCVYLVFSCFYKIQEKRVKAIHQCISIRPPNNDRIHKKRRCIFHVPSFLYTVFIKVLWDSCRPRVAIHQARKVPLPHGIFQVPPAASLCCGLRRCELHCRL